MKKSPDNRNTTDFVRKNGAEKMLFQEEKIQKLVWS